MHQGPQCVHVVGVGPGDRHRQRQSVRLGQDVQFRPGFASVDGVGSGGRSPLFARTLAPSMIARAQSSSPSAPSLSSTARCRRRHTPAWVHSWNRRCAVGTLTPNDGGSWRQEHPLVSTNTIAVSTARSPALRRPPPCRRTPCSGSSGAAMAHNSSGTNRRDRSSTDDHRASLNTSPIKTPSNTATTG
jgi:hypothetical protein